DKRLRFVTLDLTRDDGWDAAMEGVDILMHTASPFPMTQPDNEMDLIAPAVDGANRALKAAHKAGIKRVVLTSSVVAVAYGHGPQSNQNFDHTDWSNVGGPHMTPYAKSKTLAERAAWDFVRDTAPDMQLTTVNPSLVLGPPLDDHYGTSLQLIERLLSGKDPMLPRFGFSLVDVRDIAKLHVAALDKPDTIGERLIGSTGFMWFAEVAETIKAAHPERKVVTRQAPNFLIRILAIFDKAVRSIVPELGKRVEVSADHTKDLLGMEFIAPEEAVKAAAEYLVQSGKV
ncbi:MAG: NAD-dependent epimerase/dehydratase family protein, partial [Alphaproteobacteria bacterium]|nr:NAD-dependent epimerase/dehydratase family protein [Alphaproteobacteria bacterium]